MSLTHTIEEADDDIRLDRWFKRHYPGVPHSLIEKQLRKGLIRVDGKKAKTSDRIRTGQVLQCPEIKVDENAKPVRKVHQSDASEIQRWVLHKDAQIIIINKPPGLAVQGGKKISKSVDDLLDALIFDGSERPKLVHRIDRDTSGCLVLARTTKVAAKLMSLFASRQVDKTYLALVNNLPDPLQGTIDLPLRKKDNPLASGRPGGPDGRDYEIMQVDHEEGQKAVSEYRVIDTLASKYALVELKPLTGRTHQLRVHMQAIGCPIVGDHKYGGSVEGLATIGVEDRLHLHARRVVIPSPGGRPVDVSAPLPAHMKKSFKALGLDIPK